MRDVLIIVPEDGLLFEAAGIADILGHANQMMTDAVRKRSGYRIHLATTQPHRVVHDRAGLNLLVDDRLIDLDPTVRRDTVIVTAKGASDDERRAVADWLRAAFPRTRRMASVCGGALTLAESGLLDGHRATTHWRRLDELERLHPKILVERGPIYVQDGPFWTSAGVTSGFDLTLALLEDDHGFELARDVAQDLVMFLRRPGTQSQFSRFLERQSPRKGPVRELQTWILEHLDADLSVERLAERLAVSPRHFGRLFQRETGLTPARYVEEVRLEAARTRLEQGSDGVEQIAVATGFGTALNLRRAFERQLQTTPSDYRERFRSLAVA